MKEIYINADDYNTDSIKTIQGNNNAEEYKIYLQADNEKIDLTGKTVNLGFLRVGSTEGDIIENLNVTNPKEGEITLKITNKISKRNGTYSCQLAILGEGDFLEHTATFTLTVENNIFSDITKAIADSKDFTYLERILEEASKLSEKLKENTASATNANSNLEANITEANNINSKLLENTSTATSLNKNLESNINLAKEVKETIKDLDTKNIEATEKIGTLTSLNSKATELSNNINESLSVKDSLIKNTESAKTINNELIATNNDAKVKKTDLDNSLEEAKKYISGLDGSQNIPKLRLDVTELQNGLKSNQNLSYEGSSISAENTLEGRTEGMRICGRTLNNLLIPKKANLQGGWVLQDDNIFSVESDGNGFADIRFNDLPIKPNTNYTCYIEILENTLVGEGGISVFGFNEFGNGTSIPYNSKGLVQVKSLSSNKNGFYFGFYKNSITSGCLKLRLMLIEGNNNNTINYFEGLKSFGETEKVEDKYKISILSHGKNLLSERYRDKSLSVLNIYRGVQYKQFLKENTQYTLSLKFKDDFILPKGCLLALSTTLNPNDGDYIRLMDSEGNVINNQIIKESLKMSKDLYITFYNGKTIQTEDEYEDFINKIDYIQIQEGTQATQYETYKENKKDILIKEPLREGDYLYEDNGQVKICRDKSQYTVTGNEEIAKGTSLSNTCLFHLNINRKVGINNIISDKFKTKNVFSVDEEGIFGSANSSTIYIRINKSKLTTQDVEGFKAWLKANPTTIVYQLATPTIEVVENCVDIDLDTYQEKTYFSIENSLPGTLDFKVPSNIASIVQANSKAINELYNLIDTLVLPNILQNTTDIEMLKLEKLK
ncbi:BppU family phage baseplate upper protein [Clostridium perfringens]